jgi:RNA polymerase sigma-70 factor (ECF subfamily)
MYLSTANNTTVYRDEAQMILCICAGDLSQFYELIQPYQRFIYHIVLAVLKNEAEAEDAVQQALLNAFRSLEGFRSDSQFRTWLCSIALNEARLRLRQQRRVAFVSLDDSDSIDIDSLPSLADTSISALEGMGRKQTRKLIELAAQELPTLYREVLQLRYLDQLSTSETARLLGASTSSIKTRLHRARRMLRQVLAGSASALWRGSTCSNYGSIQERAS